MRRSVLVAATVLAMVGCSRQESNPGPAEMAAGDPGFAKTFQERLLDAKPGDVIEAEIERIGVLRNPVVSWQEAHGEPAPPRVRW